MDKILTPEEVAKLSKDEKEALIAYHQEQLENLTATPRSDWHAAIEADFRLDARYAEGGSVKIDAECRIGSAPPRVDFIIWKQEEGTRLKKRIYRIFRKFNIIEYKNPHDSLNWHVIYKTIGYMNLYFGLDKGDLQRDQITISIFRAVKNPILFKELKERGNLEPDEAPGIYHIIGLVDVPFQIVITSELVGDEYATERAMIDEERADAKDIRLVLDAAKNTTDENELEYYRTILNLISAKNPCKVEEVRRDRKMSAKWMEIFKPEIDEQKKSLLFSCVQDGALSPEYAAGRLNLPFTSFISEMEQAGYRIPAGHVASSTL